MINDWEAPKQMCKRMMERNSADAVFWRNVLMSWGWGWGCYKKNLKKCQKLSECIKTRNYISFESFHLARSHSLSCSHLLPFALPPSLSLTNVLYIYTHTPTHPHTHTNTCHVTTHPQTCCLTLFLSRLVTVSVCNHSFSLYATLTQTLSISLVSSIVVSFYLTSYKPAHFIYLSFSLLWRPSIRHIAINQPNLAFVG